MNVIETKGLSKVYNSKPAVGEADAAVWDFSRQDCGKFSRVSNNVLD